MQIHELNNFTGTLGAGSYVAIDDGNDTGKVSTQQILANTEARIDNIIAGEAPSAAEVTDARYGANGVTYTSLGTAIRTQFTDVKADITQITAEAKTGIFAIDFCNFVNGGVNNQTGETVTYLWAYRISSSDWFSVSKPTTIYIDSNFQINVYIKPTGQSYSGSFVNAISNSYNLRSDRDYKITIFRKTEDQSETADIRVFKSKVTYFSTVKESLENITTLMAFRDEYSGYKDVTNTLTKTDGKYINSSGVQSSNQFEYVVVPVASDSKIKVTSHANSAAMIALYFNSSTPTPLAYIGTESVTYPDNYGVKEFVDYELSIPDGTTHVFINNHKSSGELLVYWWSDDYVADLVVDFKGKNILCLGDSITHLGMGERGWVRYFNQIVEANQIDNVAVVGAHWCDYNNSTVYNGDPQPVGDEQNVVGNQVQKIINNPDDYLSSYDVIIIAAGTNDTTSNGVLTTESVNTAFYNNGAVRALADVDRSTWAGATRWVTEKLRSLFPDAIVVYNTPINRINGYDCARVINNAKMVRQCAEVNSTLLCDSLHCGVTMSDSSDFIDDLHPSKQGAKKLGIFNAKWFIENI